MVLETWQLPRLPGLSAQNIKRGLDFILTLMILTLLFPLLGGIALGVRLTSTGPIFYKSLRIGKNYQPFYMWKFRTMCTDADHQRERLRQNAGLQGQLFKLADDPRVTRFGRFLRKFSLDELPQLLNVLQGNMSLVGPRPLPPDESELFRAPFTRRFDVLPGITGLWQISGRSNIRFEDMCKLEFTYVSQWQLVHDFKILFQTVPAVLCRKGAY